MTSSIHRGGPGAAGRAGPDAWVALTLVATGLFLVVLSTTVVSVALPAIGSDLDAGATSLEWIVDAYVVVYASLLVAGGVVGDRRGRKGMFLIGVVVFGAGSLVAGLAPSVGTLLVGRTLQGLGPAMLVPGSLTIVRALFPDDRQRATAIGLWSTGSGLALAVGPALGGLIVEHLGWRWVFWMNVPLSAVLLLLSSRLLPRLDRTPVRGPFDWVGAVLTTVAVAALAFATIDGQDHGWTGPLVLAGFAAGVTALGLFTVLERRRSDPLVDVRLFARPVFAVANAAAFIVFFAFVGSIVYFSIYFQSVQGHSPAVAGLDVAAIGIAFALAAASSGLLVTRLGPRIPMIAGLLVGGLAILGLLRLQPDTGVQAIWWDLALFGAGIGLCLTPMTAVAVSAVDASRAGMVSAVHNAVRQLGQVFGVAVLGALVYAGLPRTSSAGPLRPALDSAYVDGLHNALWVCGLALLAAALLSALPFSETPDPLRERTHP